jgi:archaetidylinositol phosphate synthase
MAEMAVKQTRTNDGLLAAAEKRLLVWIAGRLPVWVSSDQLTLLALFSMVGAGAAFWCARYWLPALALVIVALATNWFGDSLDGTLARVRRHERPRYGFYVDHVLDIVGISFLLGGLALSGFMSPVIALGLLVTYLLVAGEVFLATAVHGQFRMSFLRFGPTELRIVLAAGVAMLFSHPIVTPFGLGPFLLFDIGGIAASAGLIVTLIVSTSRNVTALYRAEPLPHVSKVA